MLFKNKKLTQKQYFFGNDGSFCNAFILHVAKLFITSKWVLTQWYSKRISVLGVTGSTSAPVKVDLLGVKISYNLWYLIFIVVNANRPNTFMGRDFVITECLTVGPPENNRQAVKGLRNTHIKSVTAKSLHFSIYLGSQWMSCWWSSYWTFVFILLDMDIRKSFDSRRRTLSIQWITAITI